MSAIAPPAVPSERKQARRENWRLLRRKPGFIIGSFIVTIWVVCAVLGSRITPHDPARDLDAKNLTPRSDHWFGTDIIGRDVFYASHRRRAERVGDRSRRGSGQHHRRVDSRAPDGILQGNRRHHPQSDCRDLPCASRGAGRPPGAGDLRLEQGSGHRGRGDAVHTDCHTHSPFSCPGRSGVDYVTSARLRGESNLFIMFREILPNVSAPIVVEFTVRVGYAIFTVASLSFLGVGVKTGSPDWGTSIADHYRLMNDGIWWSTLFPALAITSIVIAVNLVADSIQAVYER